MNRSAGRTPGAVPEAGRVVEGLRGASPPLEGFFDRLLREGRELLDPAGAPAGD